MPNNLEIRVLELERQIELLQSPIVQNIQTPEVKSDKVDRMDFGCIRIDRTTGITYSVVVVTDTYTALRNDAFIIANPVTDKTITLPTSNMGKVYGIKNQSANAITVDGGDYNIDGSATNVLSSQYNWIMVVMGETEWHIVARS